jgi:hypothetical protein
VKRWLRELRASLDAIVESFARDTRLSLYGDPETIEQLGIACAKAGVSVDEVEPAIALYLRAQWFGLGEASMPALQQARELIDGAQHDQGCRSVFVVGSPCSCWKASVT